MVKRYDCNVDVIRDYNVLNNNMEDFIRKQKKKCADKEEFAEVLRRELMYRFWSKSEHELIVEVDIDRVILSPWCGCREPAKVAVDVTDDPRFDWRLFAEYHIGRQRFSSKAKIDVWDQISYRWDRFVDYCWYTHLPYERKNKKFEREPINIEIVRGE
jgi:hypothetical protein